MSFAVIQGFLLAKSEPADVKEVCADQTARLAIQYPYKGLKTRQADTGVVYRYITATPVDGSVPTNVVGDWEIVPTIFTGSGAPAVGKGVINDIWIDETGFVIYKKTGVATWTSLFSISGSHIITGVGVASGGLDGDLYIRSNGDVSTKAGGVWTYQFNIKGTDGVSDHYATTSTTSLDMTTVVAPLAITVGTGLAYTVGQSVIIASRSTPTKNLTGTITAYNTGSGAMTLNPITPAGAAGAVSDWDVNLSGSAGMQGKAFIHLEHDINLTDAKITAVQAGTWTTQNPWSASVSNDTRSSLVAPAALSGSMNGHSIAYDGAVWYDNGRWLGFTGIQGIQGIQGIPGAAGSPGPAGFIPHYLLGYGTKSGLAYGYYTGHIGGTISGILNGVVTLTTGSYTQGTLIFLVLAPGGIPSWINFTGTQTCLYKGNIVTILDFSATGRTGVLLKYDLGLWQVVSEVFAETSVAGSLQKVDAKQAAISSQFPIASTLSASGTTIIKIPIYGSALPINTTYWRYKISIDITIANFNVSSDLACVIGIGAYDVGEGVNGASNYLIKQRTMSNYRNSVECQHIEAIDVVNAIGFPNVRYYLYLENQSAAPLNYNNNLDYTIHGVPFLT